MDRRHDGRAQPRRADAPPRSARQAETCGPAQREDRMRAADIKTVHVGWQVAERVATITLDRPERKNPLTFDSYAELRDLFRGLDAVADVKAVVLTGATRSA